MSNQNYKNWKLELDADHICWLTFDREGQPVNSFSYEVMLELDQVIDEINQSQPVGVVITSAKTAGYIAGADITQFTDLQSEDEAFSLIRQGQLVFDKLEKLTMPTVALINGFCLGGGYEMALACRYRIALDDAKVKIGLPEVKLGLQPGWGGTVRLPRLIGPQKAMQIMLPGAAVSAKRAKRLGMIDACVPERQLYRAAKYFIQTKPQPQEMGFVDRCLSQRLARRLLAKMMYRQLEQKNVQRAHYPAPFAIVDRWLKDFGKPEAMENEAKSIAKLMMTSTSKQLLRVFFLQNRMKELAKGVRFKAQHVHVIGAGIMGGDIAAWCALRGLHVTLQDQGPDKIAPAMKRAYKLFSKKLKNPRLIQQAMDRLQPDVKGLGVRGADLIIEAVFEHLPTKIEIFKQVEEQAREDAILATNTSSIPLEQISTALNDPSRLIGVHFFNPVAKMPLVEIVRTENTPEDLIKKAAAFVKQIGRSPVVVLSRPGFLVNRLLVPYLNEAMTLFEEGVPKETIDQAALNFGMPMGPIELADKVGLDICLSVAKNLASHFGTVVPVKLEDMVKQGILGLKSKEGFYKYNKQGRPIKNGISTAANQKYKDVTDRLILILVNEAVSCLHEGVISDAEMLDAGMIFGTGFAPFRGGPIAYANTIGIDGVVVRLNELANCYGDRFKPKLGWEQLSQPVVASDDAVVAEDTVESEV